MTARYEKAWLAGRPVNTQATYRGALERFERITGVSVDGAGKREIMLGIQFLIEAGLSVPTVNHTLAVLSSYYRWQIWADLRSDNPAEVRRPRMPAPVHKDLTVEEMRALLQAIKARGLMARSDVVRVRAAQDYLLILGYFLLGRRDREWAEAQIADFEISQGTVWYSWQGKGAAGKQEVPAVLWEAVKEYCELRGLVKGYLFTALSNSAARLGHRSAGPISNQEVNRRIKYYAKRAGIEKRIHIHRLRHTHASMCDQLGVPRKETQRTLGHANASTTDRYVNEMAGVRNTSAEKLMGAVR